jgi:hypothetical protein
LPRTEIAVGATAARIGACFSIARRLAGVSGAESGTKVAETGAVRIDGTW